jgi:hypothetical protein
MKPTNDSTDEGIEVEVERSRLAEEIDDLRTTILRLAKDRDRLPQPLFWSLFNSRLKEIKRNKELSRLVSEVFNGTEES